MKNILASFFLILGLSLTNFSIGQIVTSNIESTAVSSTAQGFYYSLPQTILKIDVVYEILEKRKGPLSSYANEYLGVNDFVSSDGTEFNVLDVKVSTSVEPDPKQLYFVQYPIERPKDATPTSFYLNDIGGISSYNMPPIDNNSGEEVNNDINYFFSEGQDGFNNFAQYNKRKKTDTIVRQISIDTVVIDRFIYKTSWIDKTSEDKAKEAALQIEKIRMSRFNLLTGYHEVNFGGSIEYMDSQLKNLERQYLELFIGKTTRTVESRTVYFVPSNNANSGEILKFSDGKTVVIRISSNGSKKMPDSPSSSQNGIFYRIPVETDVEISSGTKVFYTKRLTINQLGSVLSAPLTGTKLIFEQNTGNLLGISRDY